MMSKKLKAKNNDKSLIEQLEQLNEKRIGSKLKEKLN